MRLESTSLHAQALIGVKQDIWPCNKSISRHQHLICTIGNVHIMQEMKKGVPLSILLLFRFPSVVPFAIWLQLFITWCGMSTGIWAVFTHWRVTDHHLAVRRRTCPRQVFDFLRWMWTGRRNLDEMPILSLARLNCACKCCVLTPCSRTLLPLLSAPRGFLGCTRVVVSQTCSDEKWSWHFPLAPFHLF